MCEQGKIEKPLMHDIPEGSAECVAALAAADGIEVNVKDEVRVNCASDHASIRHPLTNLPFACCRCAVSGVRVPCHAGPSTGWLHGTHVCSRSWFLAVCDGAVVYSRHQRELVDQGDARRRHAGCGLVAMTNPMLRPPCVVQVCLHLRLCRIREAPRRSCVLHSAGVRRV